MLEQEARYGCYALDHLQTIWPTAYPGLQENLQALTNKPPSTTTGHLVALHKEPGDPEIFFQALAFATFK